VSAKAEKVARVLARSGLVARSLFYVVLAALVVAIAVTHGHTGRQANAHGALSLIAATPLGLAAIVATAAGFLAFGVVRVVAAVRDRSVPRWRRATTALQGQFYVVLAWVPLSFAFGRRQTGSEQQQHAETATVMSWPLGRELVAAVGVVVVVVCAWQIRTALTRGFDDGLEVPPRPTWLQRATTVVGVVGIAARALVFVPVGVFLIVAAVQENPRHADGLDAELARLAREAWGPALLALVALGLLVFAAYSALEARYRDVEAGV
jgi:hypothetical protein